MHRDIKSVRFAAVTLRVCTARSTLNPRFSRTFSQALVKTRNLREFSELGGFGPELRQFDRDYSLWFYSCDPEPVLLGISAEAAPC